MSSSSVCQGLQSCLTEPRFLLMKLAPPLEFPSLSQPETHPLTPPNITCEKDLKQDKNPNADMGGWAFLQSLCNKTDKKSETEKIYVHPLVKRSSSSLSAKSLEMCTESLGCETGSGGSESSDDIALFSSEGNMPSLATPESDRIFVSKRLNRSVSNFPPPLSSMSTKGGVQVRPRREDGRLILEAVPTPSQPSCFRAERSNGRLTLQLLPTFNHSLCDDYESVEEEKEEKEEGAEEEDDAGEVEEYWDENNENEENGTGMRKIPRPSRCSENGNMSNQMLDWEPFWVTALIN